MNDISRQSGFSMIEVLVTFLLITIGILGMVALQGKTIAYTKDSSQRNTAAMLADDLFELIRANPDAILSADGNLKASTGDYYKAKGSDFPSAPSSCATTPSSASQQLACWAQEASKLLPGAADLLNSEFYVCRSTSPGPSGCGSAGSAIEIQLAWKVKNGECLEETPSEDTTICYYRLRSEP
ncbi:type IV pilus modification protein PilV [Pseudomonas sp. PS02288]|uniref:type IV pilus modification protein PilV n=1 Tax=Pseudomonas sp. PS02288 TaxID=2991443 RepID=UPI00249C0A40|nr:type IV pilus modification protein PilV [Pseudomonas sp. PS02288]